MVSFGAYASRPDTRVLAACELEAYAWPEDRTETTAFQIVDVAEGMTNASFHLIDGARGVCVADQQNKYFVRPLPPPGRVMEYDETALLIGGMTNHWHFLINFVTRLAAARALLGPDLDGARTVLVHVRTGPQKAFLERLFPDVCFREIPDDPTVAHRFRRLLYPSFPHNVRLYPELLGRVRAAALAAFGDDPAFVADSPKRIFVDRDPNIPRRRLADREVALQVLKARDVVPVLNERYDLAGQVALFAGAHFVAGLHGAGMANILFCRPGTPVLILDYKWPSEMYGLARMTGLRPLCLIAQPQPDPDREPRMRDLKVAPKQLDAGLAALLDMTP